MNKPKDREFLYVLRQDIGSSSSFTKTITVPFHKVDKIIIERVLYQNDGSEVGVSNIRCYPLAGNNTEGIIASIYDPVEYGPMEWDVNNFNNSGTFTFEVLNMAGELSTARAGNLVIYIKFISKYDNKDL